jgi:predicted NUDIX family NTP pyrophosphohydrolase
VDGSAAGPTCDAMSVDGGDAFTTGDDSSGGVGQATSGPDGGAGAAAGAQAAAVGGLQGEVDVPAAKRRRFEFQWQHKSFEESLKQFPGVSPGYLCALACLGVDVKSLLMQA